MHHLSNTGAPGRQVLVGPQSGIQSCEIASIQLAPGQTVGLVDDRERLLVCLAGYGTVDGAPVEAGSYLWLAGGEPGVTAMDDQRILEVRLPDAADADRRSARGQIRPGAFATHGGHAAHGKAFETQGLVDRASGASARVFVAAIAPGSGMGLHFHPFDQFYFILSGKLQFAIGTVEQAAGQGDLVIFPAGTAHRNWNAGSEAVIEITINVPEAMPGQPGVHHLKITEG